MEVLFGALIIIAIIIMSYFIIIYNNLVTLKNNITKNFSNIEVLLKQRHDELPKLVECCKEYMSYEQDTLQHITEIRTRVMRAQIAGDITALGKAESELRKSVGGLFALAENYPDLKSNALFMQIQNRISQLEESISDRREFYNESVNLNNIQIEQFPDLLLAKLFGFKAAILLKFDVK